VDCASADGMSNAKWRRRFDWSKQLDSLNKQYFGNHSYRWEQTPSSVSRTRHPGEQRVQAHCPSPCSACRYAAEPEFCPLNTVTNTYF
jgi:hypothetical protein